MYQYTTCKKCNQSFYYDHVGGGPRRKYCDVCKPKVNKETNRKRVKKHRQRNAENSQKPEDQPVSFGDSVVEIPDHAFGQGSEQSRVVSYQVREFWCLPTEWS